MNGHRQIGLTATVVALLAPLVATNAMAGKGHYAYQFRGASGYGGAWSYDDDYCGYSNVNAYVNENVWHDAGQPGGEAVATIYWSHYNWCVGAYSYGSAYMSPDVRSNPNAMTAVGTGAGYETTCAWDPQLGYNCDSGEVTVGIDLAFASTGEWSSHGVSNYVGTNLYGRFTSRGVGSSADASWSGVLLVDGTSWLPLANSYGQIGRSNSGSASVFEY